MTYEEFMKLELNDGVIVDGEVGTITSLLNYKKGDSVGSIRGMTTIALHDMREIAISFSNRYTGCIEMRYFVVYTGCPEVIHNRSVLDRLEVWDPFAELLRNGENSPFIPEDVDDPVYIHKPESVISGWDYSDLIEEYEDRTEERRAIYGNEII